MYSIVSFESTKKLDLHHIDYWAIVNVFSDKVVTVEAVQDDGTVVREEITQPFVTLLTDGNGKTFCEMRVLVMME